MKHGIPIRRATAAAAGSAVLLGLCMSWGGAPASAASLAAPVPTSSATSAPVKQVTLSWSPVAGATGYVVQIGQDETFSDNPTLELKVAGTQVNLPTYLPHADYAWRVAAVGPSGRGVWSAPSDAASFTRGWRDQVALIAPSGAVDGLPEFSWSPLPSASEYQVQVSGSPAFDASGKQTQASYPTVTCFTTRTRVTPVNGQASSANPTPGDCNFPAMPAGTPLYWRVRPLDHVAEQTQDVDTSPVTDEGISSRPPAPQGALDLTGCPDASDDSVVPTPSASAPAPSASASPSPSATPTPAADPTGSCDPANDVEKGSWSSTGSFSRTAAQAGTPQGTYPAAPVLAGLPAGLCSTANVCRDFPTISWAPVTGAVTYRVYVALDAAFSNIQEVVETPGLSYTPTAQWRDSALRSSYYYAVQGCTLDACGQVQSVPGTFRKSSPAAVTRAVVQDRTNTVLQWQDYADTLAATTGAPATSEAFAYHLQVARADDLSFGAPVDEATVDQTSHIAIDKTYGDGAFIWRVQAVDASSHRLPWSAPAAFTRDYTGPVPVTSASTVTGFNPLGRLAVGFNENVVGASSSTVALVKGGVVVPSTVTSAGRVVYLQPMRALLPGATYSFVTGPGLTDARGNPAKLYARTIVTPTALADNHPVIGYAGRWATLRGTAAIGGAFHTSNVRGSSVTYRFNGVGTTVIGCKSPSSGLYEVWLDGSKRFTADAYRSYSGCGSIGAVSGLARGEHIVQIKVLGTKRSASKGVSVGFDGLRVAP